jgi:hypothetical protein
MGSISILGAQSLEKEFQGYKFELRDDNGNLIAELLLLPTSDGVQVIPIHNNRNNGSSLPVDTNQPCTTEPLILSTSADPIPGGAELSVDVWSGEGCMHSFQWQVLENGTWKNIQGASTQTFEYTGLQPGEYTTHCIVRNAIGGEMMSVPITFMVW